MGDRHVVIEGPPNTRSSTTVIDDLSSSVIQALYNLPAGDDPARPYVFRNADGGPFDPDDFSRTFERHVEGGHPSGQFPRAPAHLRRLAQRRWQHPKAIQRRMRHASMQMRMDTYGHLMRGAFKGIGERMDAFLNSKKAATNSVDEDGQAVG